MRHFYGTFGQGQYYGLLKDYYVELVAPEMIEAMLLMQRAFDDKWSNVYDGLPDEKAIKHFPKGCLGRLEFKD